jgi:ferritin-like metal-binding protein YciE
MASDTPARDAVIVKYLNEAYGKERQLETALTAQIGLAQRPALKKRLREHLRETKAHAKALERRIKALGGKAEVAQAPGPEAATVAVAKVTEVANRAIAAAKGPVQALRGTGEADNELRNVRDCYWNEAEEIAHYDVIEAIADKLGDTETVKLARAHRREEQRMQAFLGRLIPSLAGDVIRDEVPASERPRPRARTARSRS